MANNLHSKICTSIISGGECKRPGCWFSHNKEFISEKITNYAHHVYGHYVITCTDDSTRWNDQQFYIPWYMICEYLSSKKIDIDTFDVSNMKFQFPPPLNCNEIVFHSKMLKKQFDQNVVFSKLNLDKLDLTGLKFNLFSNNWARSKDCSVNYILLAKKN